MTIALFLSSCGFQPLYSDKTAITAAYPAIEITNIPDREGGILRNLLIDHLYTAGRPVTPAYILQVSPLSKDTAGLGIKKDATSTRAQMKISSHIRLIDTSSNTVLLARDVRAMGGYNVLESQYATLVSEDNITERILHELSDHILTELDLYFQRRALP